PSSCFCHSSRLVGSSSRPGPDQPSFLSPFWCRLPCLWCLAWRGGSMSRNRSACEPRSWSDLLPHVSELQGLVGRAFFGTFFFLFAHVAGVLMATLKQ